MALTNTFKYAAATAFVASLALILTIASHAYRPEPASPSPAYKRNFHPYTIAQLLAENPLNWKHPLTHFSTEGYVTYKVKEGDGDWHIRVCDAANLEGMDPKHCIVFEIIPELPLEGPPNVGQHISIAGIYRYDGENPGHHWVEGHPVIEWNTIP